MDKETVASVNTEIDFEKEARAQRWVPKEEYRGNPEDWIDAQTFVERGKQINPILRANNERLMKELDGTKKQMEELRAATEEFKKFQKEQFEKRSNVLQDEIKSLREEKKRAISSGDGELAVDIDDKIDALKEEQRQAKIEVKEESKTQTQQELAPEVQAWVNDNQWYSEDTTMASVTNKEAETLHKYNPDLKGKAFFDKLDEVLETIFTEEKLGRKKKAPVRSPVEGGSKERPTANSGKHTYENLPADAKQACDRFVKQKLLTREQFVADYEWE